MKTFSQKSELNKATKLGVKACKTGLRSIKQDIDFQTLLKNRSVSFKTGATHEQSAGAENELITAWMKGYESIAEIKSNTSDSFTFKK